MILVITHIFFAATFGQSNRLQAAYLGGKIWRKLENQPECRFVGNYQDSILDRIPFPHIIEQISNGNDEDEYALDDGFREQAARAEIPARIKALNGPPSRRNEKVSPE